MNSQLTEKRISLQNAISRDRARLRQGIAQLRHVMRERTDVGQHIAKQPYRWIAGGFLVGFLIGVSGAKNS